MRKAVNLFIRVKRWCNYVLVVAHLSRIDM